MNTSTNSDVRNRFYFRAICHVSLSPVRLSLTLFLAVSVLSGSLAVRALVTKALNSDLPFLLASKIFIRTIRSSDKESTEGRATERAGCASRMSVSLSVSQSVCQSCNTPYPDRGPRPHESEVQQPSRFCPRSHGSGAMPANPNAPAPLRPSRLCSALAPGLQGGWPQHGQPGAGWLLHHSAREQGLTFSRTVHKVSGRTAAHIRTHPRTSAHGPPLLTIFNRTNRQFLQVEQT